MKRFNTEVAIVGDGITDAAACPPAAVFIGFGANVIRPKVKASTDYFCETMGSLAELFKSVGLLGPSEH